MVIKSPQRTDDTTAEPLVSKHRECQDLVVTYESRTRGSLPRTRLTHLLIRREFYSKHFPSYNTRSARLSLTVSC